MTLRNLLLVLHIFFAVVLIGPLAFNGLFLPGLIKAGQKSVPTLRFMERVEAMAGRAGAIVFILGLALVLRGKKLFGYGFGQAWVIGAMVLFILASVIGAVGIGGAVNKAIAKLEAGESASAEAARCALLGLINFALLLVIVYLMVKKPGYP
jgi:uncharacterized membrane protein